MNNISLTGRLTADPELRFTQSQKAVCNFTLAVRKEYRQPDEPEADFIRIVAWNKQAENAGKYLTKGRQAGVSGRLVSRKYTDKEGQHRTSWEVIANSVDFLDSAPAGNKPEPREVCMADVPDSEIPF